MWSSYVQNIMLLKFVKRYCGAFASVRLQKLVWNQPICESHGILFEIIVVQIIPLCIYQQNVIFFQDWYL